MALFNNSKSRPSEVMDLDANNTIGGGTLIQGDLITQGNLRLDGKVFGFIESQSKVVMGEHAELKGDLFASNSEIAGKVHGNIYVKELLVLRPTANISGDIYALRIIVEANAQIDGRIKIGESPKQTSRGAAKGITVKGNAAQGEKSA